MSKQSATYRVIEILKDLNDGKVVNVENLSYKYDTSQRTIRRDFELIKDIFGNSLISPKKGSYAMVNKVLLEDTLNSTELYMLKNILTLSEKSNLSLSKDFDKKIKETIVKEESNSPYLFKQKPYEEIFLHKDKFKKLEFAVKFKKEIRIKYNNMNKINYFTLNPYKIVFISENFYLASQIHYKNSDDVILNRIALIEEIKETGKSFMINKDMMDFIYFMQSPWATYKQDFRNYLQTVEIFVPKAQAKYFKLKKFMPTQKIEDEDTNGNIRVSYQVSSQNEVISLIKQWLPHIKVLKPRSLVGIVKNISRKIELQNR